MRKRYLVLTVVLVTMLFSQLALASNEMLIYHWWTAGGEKEAIDALLEVYQGMNPNVKIVDNPVPGGAGVEMKAVMKSLILAGQPPSTFQVHAGAEAKLYVDNELLDPINELWAEKGWANVVPKDLQDILMFDGDYYLVPVNVHRANLFFYNKKVFDQHNLTPPTTVDELLEICAKLESVGVTPLALGSRYKWEAAHLFETILLASAGPQFYNDYFQGKAQATDAPFIEALTKFGQLIKYGNQDHSAFTWDQAANRIMTGEAAFHVNGDWVKGYLTGAGHVAGVDFDVFALPVGTFDLVVDAFGLPQGAPGREATLLFLESILTPEGQQAFNPIKGSIPARSDLDRSIYDGISQRMMADLASNILVPSAVHGSAAPDAFMSDWNDVIHRFLYTGNVEQTARELAARAIEHGLVQ
mgnify:CR=1 FL=1